MNLKSIVFATVFLSIISGCNNAPTTSTQNPPVVSVEDSDKEMNAAMAKARETFNQFKAHWQDTGVQYSLKFALPTSEDGVEHIWFNPVEITGSQILAECANEPENILNLNIGDQKALDISNLSDWMIIDEGKCFGGFTIRVLASRDPSVAPTYEFVDY